MLHTINGLPAHVLLIHVVIILIPLGALFTALSAVWPAAHTKLGFLTPLTCLIALIFVPITVSAGTWLKHHQNFSGALEARIQHHANLAAGFTWYALGLFVVSAAVWWFGRGTGIMLRAADATTEPPDGQPGGEAGSGATTTATATATATATQTRPTATTTLPQWAAVTLAVVAVVVSALVTFQLVRIGDAGAHAVWQGSVSGG